LSAIPVTKQWGESGGGGGGGGCALTTFCCKALFKTNLGP